MKKILLMFSLWLSSSVIIGLPFLILSNNKPRLYVLGFILSQFFSMILTFKVFGIKNSNLRKEDRIERLDADFRNYVNKAFESVTILNYMAVKKSLDLFIIDYKAKGSALSQKDEIVIYAILKDKILFEIEKNKMSFQNYKTFLSHEIKKRETNLIHQSSTDNKAEIELIKKDLESIQRESYSSCIEYIVVRPTLDQDGESCYKIEMTNKLNPIEHSLDYLGKVSMLIRAYYPHQTFNKIIDSLDEYNSEGLFKTKIGTIKNILNQYECVYELFDKSEKLYFNRDIINQALLMMSRGEGVYKDDIVA